VNLNTSASGAALARVVGAAQAERDQRRNCAAEHEHGLSGFHGSVEKLANASNGSGAHFAHRLERVPGLKAGVKQADKEGEKDQVNHSVLHAPN
jgi:hypothetical protein